MDTTRGRWVLTIAGVPALLVGSAILLAPVWFREMSGIEIGADPNLLSETRAPGGALAAIGAMILLGTVVRRLRYTATVVAAVLYLAYGISRMISMALDGMPDAFLLAAAVVESALGLAAAAMLLRSDAPAPSPSTTPTVVGAS